MLVAPAPRLWCRADISHPECYKAHLAPDGVFAFETRNPSGTDLSTYLDEQPWQQYTDAQGRAVRLTETQVYDPIAQIMHWTLYRRWMEGGQEQPRVSRIACRFTYPQELRALLHYNGLRVIEQTATGRAAR